MANELFNRIHADITTNDVVLYMKGAPVFPQDGYSAVMVDMLRNLGVTYFSVDILEEPDLHQALKEFSNWPSVPQLYIKGTFVGGTDTVKELKASGELRRLLQDKGVPHTAKFTLK